MKYIKYFKIFSITESIISQRRDQFAFSVRVSYSERSEGKFGGKSNELIKPSAVYFRTAVTLLE